MSIVLFTDFGSADLYVGQVKSALRTGAPKAEILDLMHDVPAFDVRAGAHLLDALKSPFPAGSVFFAVVDPGVGSARDALILEADHRHYVGPDNGLLSVVAARAARRRWWRITWRPPALSESFHGRDLFAPIAAQLAAGALSSDTRQLITAPSTDFGAGDLAEIIYVDHYGNAHTGLRAGAVQRNAVLTVNGHRFGFARVFSEAPPGGGIWYENSQELIEVAVNCGSAAHAFGIRVGDAVGWSDASRLGATRGAGGERP